MKKATGYLAGKHSVDKWNWMRECGIDKDIDFQNARHESKSESWGHVRPGDYSLAFVDSKAHEGKWTVEKLIIDPITQSDILIGYFNSSDSYGSIAEIGYAAALEIPCILFFDIPESDWYGTRARESAQIGIESNRKYLDPYWLVSLFPFVSISRVQNGVAICQNYYFDSEHDFDDPLPFDSEIEAIHARQLIITRLAEKLPSYEPATSKQIQYLQHLGDMESKPLTKLEAGERIARLKKSERKKVR